LSFFEGLSGSVKSRVLGDFSEVNSLDFSDLLFFLEAFADLVFSGDLDSFFSGRGVFFSKVISISAA